ncbi:Membrane protein involved in the export of O-antigen and teichoic acid [Chitinophaga ginsengisegetis]|uniref:Membrane protein involved in the export of O-antigen and teichoic acid n=1 Tax=Chitinophaga ginsengisegetis TaxID=393003 RepID=A0A1T5N397_9BACT|nr:oligosaccharide flippase family protein [Chitinophaga ginsengisegetis]SKC94639.1 Membrane protein involved in the export of O-antigen and teichoic acid [Chitinophaga ginsengisegetis]
MAFRLLAVVRNRHFHSLLGNVIMAFFNVLSFALLVRMLSLSAFGEWVLFLATYNILDQIRTAMLQSGIIKFSAGTDIAVSRQVTGAAWYISLLLTFSFIVLSFLVYAIAYPYFSATWHFFLGWLGVMTLFSLPFNFATWVLQAAHRFDKIVQIRMLQNGSFMVLLGALFLMKQVTLHNVLYTYSLSLLITSIYCMIFRWTALTTMAARTKAQAIELYHYGRLIVGSMVSSAFLNYSDNLVLRTMLNPAAVAVYSIPQKFMEVIEIILRSFVATSQPTISAAANRNDWKEVSRAFCRYTGTVTILILPFVIGLLLFTKPLILLLAAKAYLPATDIVRIFLFSAILYPIDRFIGVTLDMINKPLINFYKNLIKLILNIVLDVVLVLLFADIRAVAIASSLNLLFAVIFGYIFLRRYLPAVNLKSIWRYGWLECKMLLSKIKLFRLQYK